jgi:hypothetical protein
MRIGHYMRDLWKPGGISTYIQRLSAAQRDAGDSVVFLDVSPTHPSWIAAEDWQCVDDGTHDAGFAHAPWPRALLPQRRAIFGTLGETLFA